MSVDVRDDRGGLPGVADGGVVGALLAQHRPRSRQEANW